VRELGLDALLRRDVLMDRHPAAIAHELMRYREYSPVAGLIDSEVGFTQSHPFEVVRDKVLPFRGVAEPYAGFENGAQRSARPRLLRREIVHFGIVLVANDEPLIAVEH
jgi:hypothetical protein